MRCRNADMFLSILYSIIHAITCTCLQEFDVRLGIIVCILHAFSQSILGVLYVSFPYLIGPSLGIFFSIFFTFQIRHLGSQLSDYLFWFFTAQQIGSVYAIIYGVSMMESILFVATNCYFLFTATFGVCFSYRLCEILRQRRSSNSILPLTQSQL